MITNIWLKSQPNKKISYPNCYPDFSTIQELTIDIRDFDKFTREFSVAVKALVRVEYRP